MPKVYTPWVKKLGQWHLYDSEEGECRCGQACLGNNYARVISPEEREKCPKCWENLESDAVVQP